MTLSSREELLFEEWKRNRTGFVADGLVSELDYLSSKIKICVVLKEVNDPKGGGWDLRRFLAEGARPQTWDNIVRWVLGLNSIDIAWSDVDSISQETRIDTLKSISVINLKKSPGTHTTNNASLKLVAKEDSEYITKQYSIYDPDITICGGTGDLFKAVAGFDECRWNRTKRGIWWYERAPSKYVIAYCHPEARVDSSLILYGLIDAVNDIYSQNL
ncbi:hypothetical protein ACVBKF_01125 [Shewanella sp. 0m-11]